MRFSTGNIPPAARREAVEEVYASHANVAMDFANDGPINMDLKLRALPDVHLATISTSPALARGRVNSNDDRVALFMLAQGTARIRNNGYENTYFKSGDVGALMVDRPYVNETNAQTDLCSILFSHQTLVQGGADIGRALKGGVLPPTPARYLLQSYAMGLIGLDQNFSPDQAECFSAHITDLACLALGASGDQAEFAKKRGLNAATLAHIKADIAANLDNPALSLDWLARRYRLPVRQIQNLFFAQNTSFSEHLTNARLDYASRLLRDPAHAHHTITAIAHDSGFGDLSWFNRAFRRRFACTPSDMRENAQRTRR